MLLQRFDKQSVLVALFVGKQESINYFES